MAVAYWGKALSVETEKLVQVDRDKLMQQELERFMRHAVGPLARRTAPSTPRRGIGENEKAPDRSPSREGYDQEKAR